MFFSSSSSSAAAPPMAVADDSLAGGGGDGRVSVDVWMKKDVVEPGTLAAIAAPFVPSSSSSSRPPERVYGTLAGILGDGGGSGQQQHAYDDGGKRGGSYSDLS